MDCRFGFADKGTCAPCRAFLEKKRLLLKYSGKSILPLPIYKHTLPLMVIPIYKNFLSHHSSPIPAHATV